MYFDSVVKKFIINDKILEKLMPTFLNRSYTVMCLFLVLFQYIRSCVSKGVRPMLSLVLRSSLQVEVLDISELSHRSPGAAPPLPQKPHFANLSLWDIDTHVRIKVVSAANVNAGDLMKVG